MDARRPLNQLIRASAFLAGAALLMALPATYNNAPQLQADMPAEEQAFIRAVTQYVTAYNEAESNEIQQDAIWQKLQETICHLYQSSN
jgi:hypothetical protein